MSFFLWQIIYCFFVSRHGQQLKELEEPLERGLDQIHAEEQLFPDVPFPFVLASCFLYSGECFYSARF